MLRKRSVTMELRYRAQAEARKEARNRLKTIGIRFAVGLLAVFSVVIITATDVLARESTIEEVHAHQLERLLQSRDFVVVFWYSSRHCRSCEEALEELEGIDDDAEKFAVDFVKINDKRLAKSVYGIKRFPALTFFRQGEMTLFEGDLTDDDEVLDFITSEAMLMIPDKIEEVTAEALKEIVSDEMFVTVLFMDDGKRTSQVLNELEHIDDEADVFKIRFVKILDQHLAEEYSLTDLPALVYFRNGIPVVYDGDLMDEPEVLEWLIQHQTTVDDEDLVESVTQKELDIMINNVDHLLVLFHDNKKKSQRALEALETIDDDCDRLGVSFVEVDEISVAKLHGVDSFPTLVYFEKEIPAVFPGDDLNDGAGVLKWLQGQLEGCDIEEVKAEMLDKMIVKEEMVAVLFYEESDRKAKEILEALEDIDDDLDQVNIPLVKTKELKAANEYGIDTRPSLVVFERGIPNLYQGKLDKPEKVLKWLMDEMSGDHSVEVVTDAMLEKLILSRKHVAVFFYDKKQKASQKALEVLEEIDDDIHNNANVFLVKIDDKEEAEEFGILKMPGLVLFENAVPNVFEGDLFDSAEILEWLSQLAKEDNIEEINSKMLEKLIEEDQENVVVYLYHKDVVQDVRILGDLENIDDDLEALDIHLIKLAEDGTFADNHNIQVVPSLIIFRERKPIVFPGDVSAEQKVLQWVQNIIAVEEENEDDSEEAND